MNDLPSDCDRRGRERRKTMMAEGGGGEGRKAGDRRED